MEPPVRIELTHRRYEGRVLPLVGGECGRDGWIRTTVLLFPEQASIPLDHIALVSLRGFEPRPSE